MLDDARETFGAAPKRLGASLNTTDPALLGRAQALLLEQKPLVRAYNSSNYEDVLLSGDLVIPVGAPHPERRSCSTTGCGRR